MATQTYGADQAHGFSNLFDDLRRTAAAISAGWRAARDWRRLSANANGMSPEQIARLVFDRNFA